MSDAAAGPIRAISAAKHASRSALTATLLGVVVLGCLPAAVPPAPIPPRAPAPAAPEPSPEPPAPLFTIDDCTRITHLRVHKASRRLTVVCGGSGELEFGVALGRESGPKRRRGDARTPEGRYRISGVARASRFHLFLPIDYPSEADARKALESGALSAAEFERFVRAGAAGMPPQDTVLGGGLGFHGEGERWRGDSAYLDWTNGCVALSDAAIDFVSARVEVGTPVEILP